MAPGRGPACRRTAAAGPRYRAGRTRTGRGRPARRPSGPDQRGQLAAGSADRGTGGQAARSRARRRPDGRSAATATRSRPIPPRCCSRSAGSMLPACTAKPAMRHAMRWLTGAAGARWQLGRFRCCRPRSSCTRWPRTAHRTPARSGAALSGCCGRSGRTGRGQGGQARLISGPPRLALPALVVAGVLPGKPAVRSAAEWLLGPPEPRTPAGRGAVGPAGEDLASRNSGGASRTARRQALPGTAREPERHGRSDPDSTALAIGALLAADGAETADPVDLAADWLVRAQQNDGGWSARARSAEAGSAGARSGSRSRTTLLPGLLAPLGALGRYAAGLRWHRRRRTPGSRTPGRRTLSWRRLAAPAGWCRPWWLPARCQTAPRPPRPRRPARTLVLMLARPMATAASCRRRATDQPRGSGSPRVSVLSRRAAGACC